MEAEISKLEQKKAVIEEKLADNALYEDAAKQQLQQVMTESNEVNQSLEAFEQEWFELSETLEAKQED